jgi:hypothetical protein
MTSAVKVIPRLQAIRSKSITRCSTNWSSRGKTAHSTLNSISHTDIASRRASLSVIEDQEASGVPREFLDERA